MNSLEKKIAPEQMDLEVPYGMQNSSSGEVNRRTLLQWAVAAAVSPLASWIPALGSKAEAQARFKAPEGKMAGNERAEEGVIEKVRAYSRLLQNNEVFKTGSLRDMIQLLKADTMPGGKMPAIPDRATLTERTRDFLYPPFDQSYLGPNNRRGFPPIRFIGFDKTKYTAQEAKQKNLLEATNAGRYGERRIMMPTIFCAKVLGPQEMRRAAPGINISAADFNLNSEHSTAPIQSLPTLRDDQVEDGVYAVALGRYGKNRGTDVPNCDLRTGAYNLSGFIKNPRRPENKKLYDGIALYARETIRDAAGLEQFMKILNKSLVMFADPDEWESLVERNSTGQDGYGQSVHILQGNNWHAAGMVHMAGMITEDGKAVVRTRGQTSGKQWAPYYLLHCEALKEVV